MKYGTPYILILFALLSFSAGDDECVVKNDSKTMLCSNSANMNFCITNQLNSIENNVIDCDDMFISVDTSDRQYTSSGLSSKLISFEIRNCRDSSILINTQENFIPFIQEALDSSGNWKPIEYWVNWSCGNAYRKMSIEPDMRIRYPIRKYKGDLKTKIRVKVKINDTVYYSNTFNGSIYPTQMDINHTENWTKISRKEWKESYENREGFKGEKRRNVRIGNAFPANFDFLD